jgi:hypothetical protein
MDTPKQPLTKSHVKKMATVKDLLGKCFTLDVKSIVEQNCEDDRSHSLSSESEQSEIV